MKKNFTTLFCIALLLVMSCSQNRKQPALMDNNQIQITSSDKTYSFTPEFTVIYTETDPRIAARKSGIENVNYNVNTWKVYKNKAGDLQQVERSDSEGGDGFDDRILDAKSDQRTPVIYNAGENIVIKATTANQINDTVFYKFPTNEKFILEAYAVLSAKPYPKLNYKLTAKTEGYFSVGFTGAPAFNIEDTEEIWQPLIWQEKRFPKKSYMTLAYRTPIPTTLVNDGQNTIGVLAAAEEFPFSPLPLLENSRFGVILRNQDGQAQPQLFAPVLGGLESKMSVGDNYTFLSYLVVNPGSITQAYENIAYTVFGFHDYRRNEIATLNDVFENIVDYSMSEYAWYIDSLKGCAYSTDVPGAVKNVSSLNPLEIALVTDDKEMFEKRAYPMMEYLISREKFLFCLDTLQKIQQPSRKMAGPAAPISELTTLYNALGKRNDFLLQMAKNEIPKKKARNLDVALSSDNWMNAMYIYKASGEEKYLEKAKELADEYINYRVGKKQTDFNDPLAGGTFFWPTLTPRWIQLFELYELTNDKKYLNAAQYGARLYTMFTWMSPKIPEEEITVNKGGKAPYYWYLKSKGHARMYYPEEQVPAWRLSEMGLTPESTGTSTGHRAIFMANWAPWMLRIGYYTNDQLLKDVAKSAIIGRYRNFPGYHINTARTTAYEKADYPYHKHKELSVNSFHYNHILPMASTLLDYMVTDAFVKSEGKIDFPSDFIEGYAYLQNKFYGHQPGKFYATEGVSLWMPKDLLTIQNVELNYISARKGNTLFVAFMNQSHEKVVSSVKLSHSMVNNLANGNVHLISGKNVSKIVDGEFEVTVAANGLTAVKIEGVEIEPSFQTLINAQTEIIGNSFINNIEFGNAKAMLFNMGSLNKKAYIYLQDTDAKFKNVTVNYTDASGNEVRITKNYYPFEFTIPLAKNQTKLHFNLTGVKIDGSKEVSGNYLLGQ